MAHLVYDMLSWLTESSIICTALRPHTVLQINWIISFVHLIGEQLYFELNPIPHWQPMKR